MQYRFLLVDGTDLLRETLNRWLRKRHGRMDVAGSAGLDLESKLSDFPNLIVINAAVNQGVGLRTCARLRRRGVRARILVVARPGTLQDKLAAFKAGADDCMTSPIDAEELYARVEALLRRPVQSRWPKTARYDFDGIGVDLETCQVMRNGTTVKLSPMENRLLQCLIEQRGSVVSRDFLLREVWGHPAETITRTVDVHIQRLRQKVERDPKNAALIVTVPGLGYRLNG